MNKIILAGLLSLILVFGALGQVTTIYDIQYTTDPSGDSPLLDAEVTVTGIVTAEHRGDVRANGGISGSYFFMQDTAAAWSGIQVLFSDNYASEGDSVTVTGVVGEFNNQTQIGGVTEFIIHSAQNEVPGPIEITSVEADTSEAYEGCLVRVLDANVTEIGIGSFGNWNIDD